MNFVHTTVLKQSAKHARIQGFALRHWIQDYTSACVSYAWDLALLHVGCSCAMCLMLLGWSVVHACYSASHGCRRHSVLATCDLTKLACISTTWDLRFWFITDLCHGYYRQWCCTLWATLQGHGWNYRQEFPQHWLSVYPAVLWLKISQPGILFISISVIKKTTPNRQTLHMYSKVRQACS